MSEASNLIVQTIFIVADLVFFFFSIVGNSVVIYVISRDKKLKSKSNYHILSVAAADLLIGLFGIPFGTIARLTGAPHNFFCCLVLNSSLFSAFGISIYSLVAVSFDRCWAVCFPVTYHIKSTTTTKFIIAFCWVLGIFVGFLPTLGWNSGQFDDKCDLRVIMDFNYLLFICVGIALISTVGIVTLYLLVYYVVLKQAKRRQEIVVNSPLEKQQYEVRAAVTLAMIVGTFILLWLPGIISCFIISITKDRNFPADMMELSIVLVHLNAAIDPLIYAYRMNNIKEALKNLFTLKKHQKTNLAYTLSYSQQRSVRQSLQMSPPGENMLKPIGNTNISTAQNDVQC